MTGGQNVNNGKVIKNEYLNLTKKQVESTGNKELLNIFNSVDTNKNGVLDTTTEASIFGQKSASVKNNPLKSPAKAAAKAEATAAAQKKASQNVATSLITTLGKGVNSVEFQASLKAINADNVVQVLASFKKQNNNETLLSEIVDKRFQSNDARQNAISTIYKKLCDAALKKGHDKKTIESMKKGFEDNLEKEFSSFGFVDADTLAWDMNLMYAKAMASPEEMQKKMANLRENSQAALEERLREQSVERSDAIASNSPVASVKRQQQLRMEVAEINKKAKARRVEERKSMPQDSMDAESLNVRNQMMRALEGINSFASGEFEKQMKKDGWAGDAADGISYLWNNALGEKIGIATGNTAENIRSELTSFGNKLAMLKEAAQTGNLEAEFEKQFGIKYSKENMEAFINVKSRFENATKATMMATMVNNEFADVVKGYEVRKSLSTNSIAPRLKEVSADEFIVARDKVEGFFGAATILKVAKEKGVNFIALNMNEKYAFYCELASAAVKQVNENQEKALGGQTLDDLAKGYNSSFKKAFGNNNILTKVEKYNHSQETGTSIVKGAAEVVVVVGGTAIVVASGGTATPLVAAGLATAASATVEVTDRATNDIDGDLSLNELGGISKKALISGAFTFVGGKATKAVLSGATQVFGSVASETTIKVATGTVMGGSLDLASDFVSNGKEAFTVKNVLSRYVGALVKNGASTFLSGTTVQNLTKVGVKSSHTYLKKGLNREAYKKEVEALKAQILKDAEDPKKPEAFELARYMQTNPTEFDNILMSLADA